MTVQEIGAQPVRGKVFYRMVFKDIKQLSKCGAVGAGGIWAVSLKQEVLLEAFVFRKINEVNLGEYGFAGNLQGHIEQLAMEAVISHIPFFIGGRQLALVCDRRQ